MITQKSITKEWIEQVSKTQKKRIQGFIYGEKYYLDTAIINASKVAYLSTLIANNLTEVEHFDKNNIQELQKTTIEL